MQVSIDPFFTLGELNQLARESKFVQRDSKLKGHMFLDLIVFNSENLKKQSLNDLSIAVTDKFGFKIERQSLQDRFNMYALAFLKKTLETMVKKQVSDEFVLTEFQYFNRIIIKDSVCFQIDESLAEHYPGSGGSGSGAAIRIQFEYDILCGRIIDLSINAFNEQDTKDSVETIELTQERDLIIRDLAYMNLQVLRLIIKRLAFFLCRPNSTTNIYKDKVGKDKINFKQQRNFMKKHNISIMEKTVYMGSKERIKVRLIMHLMPPEEVSKRIRKAKENSKKKGRSAPSSEYIDRAHLNLFITNASEEQIPAENTWLLYRLRWQIELMFKIWKSVCDIEKVKKVKKHRLECYVYSKLIFIVLGWQIIWRIAKHLFRKEGKALSFYKAYKTLVNRKIDDLRDIFMLGKGKLKTFMNKFYDISRTNHLLERRMQTPTSLEILLGCSDV